MTNPNSWLSRLAQYGRAESLQKQAIKPLPKRVKIKGQLIPVTRSPMDFESRYELRNTFGYGGIEIGTATLIYNHNDPIPKITPIKTGPRKGQYKATGKLIHKILVPTKAGDDTSASYIDIPKIRAKGWDMPPSYEITIEQRMKNVLGHEEGHFIVANHVIEKFPKKITVFGKTRDLTEKKFYNEVDRRAKIFDTRLIDAKDFYDICTRRGAWQDRAGECGIPGLKKGKSTYITFP